MLNAIRVGLVVIPAFILFDQHELRDRIERGQVKAPREVASADEPLNPEVISEVRDLWGLTLRDGFGQTETRNGQRKSVPECWLIEWSRPGHTE